MTILCIDDSATLRKIVSLSLKGIGYTVIDAENGQVGLEKLAENKVDCIILDINMPVMGGIEFLIEKTKVPAYTNIPVVVFTTQDEAPLRAKALSHGANGFLSKPCEKEEIIEAIQKAIGD